ncbi:MAG TPA: hypothetical protein PK181_04420 [Methanothrix soehngenii]|nr:hypothetical protein [Methanothrix soehngenii]
MSIRRPVGIHKALQESQPLPLRGPKVGLRYMLVYQYASPFQISSKPKVMPVMLSIACYLVPYSPEGFLYLSVNANRTPVTP